MSDAYNHCAECGEKRDGWSHRRGLHRFVDPRLSDSPPPVRTLTRAQALREGFVEVQDIAALPEGVAPAVGDQAVVYARGDLRLGLVSKVGRTTIYVSVATPTSPDLVTQGRIGGRWQERGYLKPKEASA
jgi:hypothetical protein